MKGRAVMSSMLDLPSRRCRSASKKRAKSRPLTLTRATESALCPHIDREGVPEPAGRDVRADRRTGLSRRHLRVHRYPARPGPDPVPTPDLTRVRTQVAVAPTPTR